MGMFDEIKCKVPLPVELDVEHREHLFQTKSLECGLNFYEIRTDGSLWREAYRIEDQSDPNATGLFSMAGCMARVDKHWVPCDSFIGEIVFYSQASAVGVKDTGQTYSGWIEFSAYFVGGKLKHLELLRYDEPATVRTIDWPTPPVYRS